MTYKIKRFSSICLLIFVAATSIASSFFVYPAQNTQAQGLFSDCADPKAPVEFKLSKTQLSANETVRWYAKYKAYDPSCKDVAVDFRGYLYNNKIDILDVFDVNDVTGTTSSQEFAGAGVWNNSFGGYEAGGEIRVTLDSGETVPAERKFKLWVEERGDNRINMAIVGNQVIIPIVTGNATHAEVVPPIPVVNSQVVGTGLFSGVTFEYSDLKITATTAETYGINVGQPLNIKYGLSWASGTKTPLPVFGQDTLNTNTAIGNPILDPTMRGLYLGLNFPGSKMDCLDGGTRPSTWTTMDCQQGIINDNQVSSIQNIPTQDQSLGLPFEVFAEKVTPAPTPGNPTTIQLTFFPVIDLNYDNSLLVQTLALCKVGGTVSGVGILLDIIKDVKCEDFLNTDKAYSDNAKTINVKVYAEGDTVPPEEVAGVGVVSTTGTGTTNPNDNKNGFTGIVDFIAKVISALIWAINVVIYNIFALVILPLLEALLSIRTYTDAFALVILPGWELLRNLANIFFIIVLLVIGLATLFRVQKYQYKNLLVNLILAALLVNFSLIITQSVVAVAETVQHQFLPEDEGGKAIKVIANRLMIAPLEQGKITPAQFQTRLSDSLSKLVFPIFYLSLAIMAFVVMVSLVFFVLVRMLIIWVLLMTSPIAFVAWILPDTKQWTTKWFNYLTKYAFFVAIMGFFLNISAYVAQKQEGILAGLYQVNQASVWGDFLSRIATNIFVMGFLLAGIFFASSSGVIGSKTMAKWAKAGGALPFKALAGAGKALGERGFEGVQNTTGVTVDPREWKKGYQSYMKKRGEDKADRLKKRKMGESWVGNKFGKGVGSALGSPEQFLENFGSGAGWSTLGKKISGNKIFKNLKGKADQAQTKAEEVNNILTEDERHDNLDKIKKLEAEQAAASGSTKIQGGTDQAKELSGQIDLELAAIQKAKRDLARGTDPDKVSKNDALDKKAAALEEAKLKIEGASGDIDDEQILSDVKALDEAVYNKLHENVVAMEEKLRAGLPNVDDHQAEIDRLTKIAEDDDRLRANHEEIDTFNPDPPVGYKKFSTKEKEDFKTKADIAANAVDDMNFKQLLKAQVESNKKQAEIAQEFKDKGLGEDPSRIFAEMESARGKKDEKDRMAVLMKMIAENGHTGSALDHFGHNRDADGYREFMKSQLGYQDKKDDKRVNAIISKLDEIHKKNGDHGFAHMTERVGSKVILRNPAVQKSAYEKAVAYQTTANFLKSPETNLFDTVTDNRGQVTTKLKDGARKRFEAMNPTEAGLVISQMSPGTRKKLMNTQEFKENKIKWQVRSEADAQKKNNKYTSVKEALTQSTKL